MEPVVGFEPTTDGLQNRCSTTELNWPNSLISLGFLSRFLVESPKPFQHTSNRFCGPQPQKTYENHTQRLAQSSPICQGGKHLLPRGPAAKTLAEAVEAFMAIGSERNRLVHQDYASFPVEKTLDEIYSPVPKRGFLCRTSAESPP
jgi:hypothetical protein